MEYFNVLDSLSKSKFRSSFKLKQKDIEYIKTKGLSQIESHCKDFIEKRLSDPTTFTDGKQTPTRGHPVFIAQHATATCCRGCLFKWHKIEHTHILSTQEKEYIRLVIMQWIILQLKTNGVDIS